MIRIPQLPAAAQAALSYRPPHAQTSGTRYIPLTAVVEAIDHGAPVIDPQRAHELIDMIVSGTTEPVCDRACALLTLSTANAADIPDDRTQALARTVGSFMADDAPPELAFAATIAGKTWSDEKLFTPIDFPNAVYERLPGRIKILAAKSLASKWGYDHVYVRHIMSNILGEDDADTITAAVYELRSAGLEATIFLPELIMLYAMPALHGLEMLVGTRIMKELETTISIMSGAVVYSLSAHLAQLHAAWRDRSTSTAILQRIVRLAEPAPHLARWLIPHLEEIRDLQRTLGGSVYALMTDAAVRKIKRWNGDPRPSKRVRNHARMNDD